MIRRRISGRVLSSRLTQPFLCISSARCKHDSRRRMRLATESRQQSFLAAESRLQSFLAISTDENLSPPDVSFRRSRDPKRPKEVAYRHWLDGIPRTDSIPHVRHKHEIYYWRIRRPNQSFGITSIGFLAHVQLERYTGHGSREIERRANSCTKYEFRFYGFKI